MIKKRISLLHCLWAVPFFLIGTAFFLYTLFHGLGHITDSLTQVVVPGKTELSLRAGKTYTVFLEEQSVVNGKIYATTDPIGGLECRLTSVGKNASITLSKPSMDTTYQVGGRSGHAILEFTIPSDGRYDFGCDYPDLAKGPEVVLAVGAGVGADITRAVFAGIASIFGGFGAGAVVVLVVLLKRFGRRGLTNETSPV